MIATTLSNLAYCQGKSRTETCREGEGDMAGLRVDTPPSSDGHCGLCSPVINKTVEPFHNRKTHGHTNDVYQSGSTLTMQRVNSVQKHCLETDHRLVRVIRQYSLVGLSLEHQVVMLLACGAVEFCLPQKGADGEDLSDVR